MGTGTSGAGPRLLRVRTGILLAVLALLLGAGAAPCGAALSDAPKIATLRFRGNKHLGDGALLSVMKLKPPSWTRPLRTPRFTGEDVLAQDLGAVLLRYENAGYPLVRVQEAVVRYRPKGDAVDIRIVLDEGPRVHVGRVVLDGILPEWKEELSSRIRIAPGELFNRDRAVAARDSVQGFARGQAYARANADLQVRYRGDSADVVVVLDRGEEVRVDSVRVEGLNRSRPALVTRELTLGPGDLLIGRKLDYTQERILGTGVFERAQLFAQTDSTKPLATLVLNLAEKKRGWYGAGAGYTSSDRLRFSAEWGLRNLTGMGRQVDVSGNLYYSLSPGFRGGGANFKEGIVQADYIEPWLFHTRTRGIVSPYLQWLQEETFQQRTLGYALTLRRDLRRGTRGSIGFQNKRVATSLEGVVPHYTTRFVNLDVTDDQRDNVFDASRGHLSQGGVEYAGGLLGGTNEFGRVTGTWQKYVPLQPGWTIAMRLKGGWMTPIGRGPLGSTGPDTLRLSRVPWEERFRLGGGNSIRGYPEDGVGRQTDKGAIGGLAMALANIEIRFPIVWIVQGGLFLDMGNVWADPAEIKLKRFTRGLSDREYNVLNAAYGMGVGLRFRTPIGPFRVDYGFKAGSGRAPHESPGELHVALGQAF